MSGPDLRQTSAREPLLIGAAAMLFLAGVLWWAMAGSRPSGHTRGLPGGRSTDARYAMYVGDRSCRECHPGQSAQHSRSGHARTFRPATERGLARQLDGQSFGDPELAGVTWAYALRDGQLHVDRAEGSKIDHLLVQYAFGSGRHATTFVTLLDPDPVHSASLEHRLTYFASTGSVGVTPGQTLAVPEPQKTPLGYQKNTAETLKCFRCHTTVTSDQGPAVLDLATMIPNVTCERCHGPARSHVEMARRGAQADSLAMPLGPGGWTADSLLRLCGQCHRHPDTGRTERIRPDNPEIVRFQPVGLIASRCYTQSDGALSCINCHNPHARASSDQSVYEAACLSCHSAAPQTVCPVSPQSACIGCHMPRRDAGQGVLFTDHWIRVYSKSAPLTKPPTN